MGVNLTILPPVVNGPNCHLVNERRAAILDYLTNEDAAPTDKELSAWLAQKGIKNTKGDPWSKDTIKRDIAYIREQVGNQPNIPEIRGLMVQTLVQGWVKTAKDGEWSNNIGLGKLLDRLVGVAIKQDNSADVDAVKGVFEGLVKMVKDG